MSKKSIEQKIPKAMNILDLTFKIQECVKWMCKKNLFNANMNIGIKH